MQSAIFFLFSLFLLYSLPYSVYAETQEATSLQDLVNEAFIHNPDLLVAEARIAASAQRIPQAVALPDPMLMFGYQNEGFRRITIGEESNAMGMFSLSQMFYFPGKRALKGEMAAKDTESLKAMAQALRLKVAATVKLLYWELFLAHKSREIISSLTGFYSRVEGAATARYASGTGSQQEVVMAQREKYMLLEKDEMQKEKIQAAEGMLNAAIGRPVDKPLGKPVEVTPAPGPKSLEEMIGRVKETSPEIRARQAMVKGAQAKVKMAKKEYYPDVTLSAGYYPKTQGLLDMWSLTATINLPVYFTNRQKPALLEAQADLLAAERELSATEFALTSSARENHAMVQAAERLILLYKEGLIPKTEQDFHLALAGYAAGKTEAITVISRLKALLDVELLYWSQYVEREKAMARLEAISALDNTGSAASEAAGSASNAQRSIRE